MIRPLAKNVSCNAAALPMVIAVSIILLILLLGLLSLWGQETQYLKKLQRYRQAQADIRSISALYRYYPDREEILAGEGCCLYDTIPESRVFLRREPWGFYELVHFTTADSLLSVCCLMGTEPDVEQTLFIADKHAATTLAGVTNLQGTLRLPQNGIIYGRMSSDFFRGNMIPQQSILRSDKQLPQSLRNIQTRSDSMAKNVASWMSPEFMDSLTVSFRISPTVGIRMDRAMISNCNIRGRIILLGDELQIDSTCLMENVIIMARKITVNSDSRIAAQLFASDTVLIGPRACLEYPSGICAGRFVELGERSEVNGYVVVRDAPSQTKVQPNYRQARTARLRGLLRVEGIAQLQGIVSGCAILQQVTYFSSHGYYENMLYDCTLLKNPVTAMPIDCGVGTDHRMEIEWVN